jgi:hypothetical protein
LDAPALTLRQEFRSVALKGTAIEVEPEPKSVPLKFLQPDERKPFRGIVRMNRCPLLLSPTAFRKAVMLLLQLWQYGPSSGWK